MDDAFPGQVIGTMMLTALIDPADDWYNLRRLEPEVYATITPAIRLYQRLSFDVEGTFPAYAWRYGAYADAYAMVWLRDESPIATASPTPSLSPMGGACTNR